MAEIHVMITKEETRLVRGIASTVFEKYCPAGEQAVMTRDDLYHWGIIGLCEAKQRYDDSRDIPFPVFSARRIEGEMIDNIRKLPMIRLPQEKQNKVKELKAAREDLFKKGGPVSPETLAEKLGWRVDEVHNVLNLSPSLTFMVDDSQDEDDIGAGGEILRDNSQNPEELTIKKELARAVNRCLEALSTATDRLVLTGRILKNLTLKDLADTLNCSLEKVRLVQKQAEGLMRDCLERQGWGGR